MPTVTRDGATIWWTAEGRGPTVLLISGLSSPSDLFFRLVEGLGGDHRTVRFDNRGVGRTGVPPGPYPMATMAADAAAVLEAAGDRRAHVVGLSMGGLIAQELALTFPERVRSLVLASTHRGLSTAVPGDPEALVVLASGASLPPEDFQRAAIPFTYAAGTPRQRIEEDLQRRAAMPTAAEGYANQLLGCQDFDRSAELGNIVAPTLVIHGVEDRLVPPENARMLAEAIPGSRLALMEGASHQLFTDQPQRAVDVLLDFFADVETAAGAAPDPVDP